MAELKPLRVLIADDEPLAAERLQLLLARPRARPGRHRERRRERGQHDRSAAPGPAAARHRHARASTASGSPARSPSTGPSPAVIFVTAFDQFAVAAFEVEAVDYLMKPVDPAGSSARSTAPAPISSSAAGPAGARQASQWLEEFWASDLSGLVRIAARDIDRVSAERDYMRLHVGRRSWLIHHSMAALEEGLDPGAVRPAAPLGDRPQGLHCRLHAQPVGPLDRPARRRHRAAGRPALFRPGPGIAGR